MRVDNAQDGRDAVGSGRSGPVRPAHCEMPAVTDRDDDAEPFAELQVNLGAEDAARHGDSGRC